MTIPFKTSQLIALDNVSYRVLRQLNESEIQIEHLETGRISTLQTNELLDAYGVGRLRVSASPVVHASHRTVASHRHPVRLAGMGAKAKSRTLHRIEVMTRLDRLGSFEKGEAGLVEDLEKVARELGCEPEHPSTARKWRKRYFVMQKSVRAFFSEIDLRGGRGQSRLECEVEAIIHEKIDSHVLDGRRRTAEVLHDAVFLAIQEVNATRIPSEWLTVPSLRTMQRRIAEISAYDRAVAEYGVKEADRRFANMGRARSVSRILEIVEIDHSPVDCLVTNEAGVVIGRPTITVVLDRKSRCVLGYHLSLAGHGVPAVFSALRHALLPKSYLRTSVAFRDLNLDWECHGWMETVLADNGSEFHANAVRDALLSLGIQVEFAASRSPNDKPHVERFLKTFNYSFIHRLPGTTLARVGDRKGFHAEKEACLTLVELDRLIHVWIIEKYHVRPHGGLSKRAPITVWREGAAAHPPQLKEDAVTVDVEFSNVDERTVQHYGIDLNNFVYTSPELQQLRRLMKRGQTVTVKWPEADAGYVLVLDPFEETFMRVPNKDPQYNSLTVQQAKHALKSAAAGDPDYKHMGANAEARIGQMVDAGRASKKMKDRRKAARLSNQTSKDGRESAEEKAPKASRSEGDSIESMPLKTSWDSPINEAIDATLEGAQ